MVWWLLFHRFKIHCDSSFEYWVHTSFILPSVHMQRKLHTQYERASLCGLFSSELCVLLWVVKLQWLHKSLKTSLALSMQNVQQTACTVKRKRENWNNYHRSLSCRHCLTTVVTKNKLHIGIINTWNNLTSKMRSLWCQLNLPLSLQTWPWWMTGSGMC